MAHIPRLYVSGSLENGAEFDLDTNQAQYLTRVMRLGSGATIRVFNGRDGEWLAELVVTGKHAQARPKKSTRVQSPSPDLTLLFAPLKRTRTELLVEKATELGVSRIIPVITDYTQSSRVRIDRLEAHALEAAEQTERLDIPVIDEPVSLSALVSNWDKAQGIIYCDEAHQAVPMAERLSSVGNTCRTVLIGPEGGFSPKEQSMLRSHDFVYPVTLGPRILRAETAAISALTLWQSVLGDWQSDPYVPSTDKLAGGPS